MLANFEYVNLGDASLNIFIPIFIIIIFFIFISSIIMIFTFIVFALGRFLFKSLEENENPFLIQIENQS